MFLSVGCSPCREKSNHNFAYTRYWFNVDCLQLFNIISTVLCEYPLSLYFSLRACINAALVCCEVDGFLLFCLVELNCGAPEEYVVARRLSFPEYVATTPVLSILETHTGLLLYQSEFSITLCLSR